MTLERSRGEIILFALASFGVWLSIWAITLLSTWLAAASFAFTLAALLAFALRDSD
jgi:hypothetical protein